MTASDALERRVGPRGPVLSGVLALVGLGLLVYGGYMHVTMGDRTLGACVETGVCNPWDPQWVLAPLVVGVAFVGLAGLLAYRRSGEDRG